MRCEWNTSALVLLSLLLPAPGLFDSVHAQSGPVFEGYQADPKPESGWAITPAIASEASQVNDELIQLKMRVDELEKLSNPGKVSEGASQPEMEKDSLKNWTVKFGGHVQMDYINWTAADPAIPNTNDYFEFRRLRLVANGTGYGFLDFRLQMTLEPESVGESVPGTVTSPEVKDAYLSINEIPIVGRARIGNFFVPFSLEQVTNDTNNIFLERSIPTQGISVGWGAWEAKARWSHLDLNNLNAGQYNDFTLGTNWYWNDRVRMMFDWIHPITSQQTVFGATKSDILASRFDFNW